MPVYNSDVSRTLGRMADLLEIEGANRFRVRAYRNAARTIATLPRNIADMIDDGEDLTEMEGIGKELAAKIQEIVETGDLEQLEEIEERTPPELAEMLRLPGLGPKRVKLLYDELGITTLEELEEAARAGKVRELEGLGEKTEQKIIDELARTKDEEKRTRIDVAEELAEPLVRYLRGISGVERVEVAGSYRRRQETIGDLDILATGENGQEIIERFVEYEDVQKIVSQGETRSTVLLRLEMQVDLRVVHKESYGAAMHYFTGSKEHNIAVRRMGVDRGLKVNEYGVFRDDERIAGETEEEIYDLFDLDYVPAELRENRGELEAAREGRLPQLITVEDIRGDLQSHTTASDGKASLKQMAEAAKERGYAYLAITDHSTRVAVTQGLDAEGLAEQMEEIDRLNDELDGIRLLKGIEVDILDDGSLDLSDDVLGRVDLTVCSVHSSFGMSRDKQTERIIRAMDNPHFNILAHPTGRLIGERQPYDIDLERIMEAALERGCFLEINASPNRLDLDDVHAKMAKEMGLKLAISTDAHRVSELGYMRFGVDQARRGWIEPDDVLNTRSWDDLRELLKRG